MPPAISAGGGLLSPSQGTDFFMRFLLRRPTDLKTLMRTQVLNGIFERDDWMEACKLPLGVIPGGTGNGLAR